jgi:hypothetical protein
MGATGFAGAVSRAVGLFVPPRSSLRRRSDRIEVGARWVLVLLGLCFLPVALSVGSETAASLEVSAAAQRAERHQVTAVVLADPEDRAVGHGAAVGDLHAPVRWIGADGAPRVALVRVPDTARVGDPRVLWVDREERPAATPPSPSYPGEQGVLTTLTLVLADLALSLLLLAGLRRVLDRARMRAWEEAWRRFTGPDTESLR